MDRVNNFLISIGHAKICSKLFELTTKSLKYYVMLAATYIFSTYMRMEDISLEIQMAEVAVLIVIYYKLY